MKKVLKNYIQKNIFQQLKKHIVHIDFNKKVDSSKNIFSFSNNEIAVYIHFPFCDSACKNCSFSKTVNQDQREEYCDALLQEFDIICKDVPAKTLTVSSVYFGGGTPSLIPKHYFTKIIDKIFTTFHSRSDLQVTLECNPSSLQEGFIDFYTKAGVNRFSIGVQSFHERVLNELGRPHNTAHMMNILNSFSKHTFQNFNIDLIYGFKSQTSTMFLADIKNTIDLGAGHVTMFPLITASNSAHTVDKDQRSKQEYMYWTARKLLCESGYIQYSVEDFSKKEEYQNRYQIDAWKTPSKEVLVFGTAGFGTVNGHFYMKEKSLTQYMNAIKNREIPITNSIKIKQQAQFLKKVLFGLHFIDIEKKVLKSKNLKNRFNPVHYLLPGLSLFDIISLSSKKISLKEEHYFSGSLLWGEVMSKLLLR